VGGNLKISHPPPASTESKPRTSAKNARSDSASLEKMIAWTPTITTARVSHAALRRGLEDSAGSSRKYDRPFRRLAEPSRRRTLE
jgi:hypothetical protein